jgi:hypothetical protein
MRRIGFDFEFLPNNLTGNGWLTAGFADNFGQTLYMVNENADWGTAETIPWMVQNVLPHIEEARPAEYVNTFQARQRIQYFMEMNSPDAYRPTLYAWCGAQDMVRLHGMWDHDWSEMPKTIPHSFVDIEELLRAYGYKDEDLPPQPDHQKHHALHDAEHDLDIVGFILDRRPM